MTWLKKLVTPGRGKMDDEGEASAQQLSLSTSVGRMDSTTRGSLVSVSMRYFKRAQTE
jgi:hypothetical protein